MLRKETECSFTDSKKKEEHARNRQDSDRTQTDNILGFEKIDKGRRNCMKNIQTAFQVKVTFQRL